MTIDHTNKTWKPSFCTSISIDTGNKFKKIDSPTWGARGGGVAFDYPVNIFLWEYNIFS
jgi:hypothetical protein